MTGGIYTETGLSVSYGRPIFTQPPRYIPIY